MLMSPKNKMKYYNRKDDGGTFLKAKNIFSYAELSFLKAEAGGKRLGFDAEGNYLMEFRHLFGNLGLLGDTYSDYITNTGVAFDGTLDIIMHKWIAYMFNGDEA